MDIVEFLMTSDISRSVVLFHAKSGYPGQFFFWLLHQHKKTMLHQVLSLDELDSATVKATVQTSFLGQSCMYWLRNVSDITQKARLDILTFLSDYQGPNHVWLFAYNTDINKVPSTWQDVLLPDELTYKDCMRLIAQVPSLQSAYMQEFVPRLFQERKSIMFDEFFMVQRYFQVLSSKQLEQFMAEWLEHIISDDASLFRLSQYFFAKDTRPFFIEWHKAMQKYNEQFWIVYWAEQLWRAAAFITLARKNQRAQAKPITYKLPFTFLQSDWRDYSVRELKGAHAFLYDLDVNIKSGSSPMAFDLFFSKFFAGQFQ